MGEDGIDAFWYGEHLLACVGRATIELTGGQAKRLAAHLIDALAADADDCNPHGIPRPTETTP